MRSHSWRLPIRRRVLILSATLWLLCLVAAPVVVVETASGPGTDAAFNDWITWDWKLDRIELAHIFIHTLWRPDDPRREYAEAVSFVAPGDSIGLVEFAACSAGERQERRRLAAKYHAKAMRFRRIVLDHWHYNQDGWSLAASPSPQGPPGTRGGLSRCLHNLINATGLCPAEPYTWYDLAYMASVIGDSERQEQALSAAWQAINYAGESSGAATGQPDNGLRQRLALDRAWLYRDRGQWSSALAWVDSARAYGARAQAATAEESRLLRGLALAGQGQFVEASQQARSLSSITTYLRSMGSGYTKRAWHQAPSDYAARWIQAMAYLTEGNYELAAHVIGRPNTRRERPYAHRFWNDVGLVFELAGDPSRAGIYYGMAAIHQPLFIYYPYLPRRGLSAVHDFPGSGLTYFRPYDLYYACGSLYSYAANTALAYEIEADPERQRWLARHALEALDRCERYGIRVGQTLALRGRLHFLLEDFAQAQSDLDRAVAILVGQGGGDARTCYLAGATRLFADEYRAAKPYLESALRLDGQLAYAWNGLGVARVQTGEGAAAREAFDMALALAPHDHGAWYNRALLSFQAQDWQAASDDLAMAAVLAPDNEDVARLASWVQAAQLEVELQNSSAGESRSGEVPLRAGARVPGTAAASLSGPPGSTSVAAWVTAPSATRELSTADIRQLESANELTMAEAVGARHLGISGAAAGAASASPSPPATVLDTEGSDPAATERRQQARILLTQGHYEQVQELLESYWLPAPGAEQQIPDMVLLLEADRARGLTDRALATVSSLTQAGRPPYGDVGFWSLVASICLDSSHTDAGRRALDAAISLDPGNAALRFQRQLVAEH